MYYLSSFTSSHTLICASSTLNTLWFPVVLCCIVCLHLGCFLYLKAPPIISTHYYSLSISLLKLFTFMFRLDWVSFLGSQLLLPVFLVQDFLIPLSVCILAIKL